MKRKVFTLGIFLFFLLGIGSNVYGQAAGDYVFTGVTDASWNTLANWSISDGAGGYTGTATQLPIKDNNVYVPSGKSITANAAFSQSATAPIGTTSVTLTAANSGIFVGMTVTGTGIAAGTYVAAISGTSLTLSTATNAAVTTSSSLSFTSSCKNLVVNGSFTTTGQLNCYGDITVNTAGTFTIGTNTYCTNIYNYGTFNATSQYNSTKSLYPGFIGTAPGAGDYVIVNDGTFGGTGPSSTIGTGTPAVGSGIRIYYSEQCTSFTIRPSSSSVTTYAFNIGGIMPNYSATTSTPSNQVFTLNLNETMSLLFNNGYSLSLQQGNQTSATRTCNIPHGVTVYSGGRFHANANIPTQLNQGDFIYNIYGTLDLGTYLYASSAVAADFDLCLTSYPNNTSTLTFNLGDGTSANAGTLIIGSNMKIIKQKSQNINIKFNDYSSVKYVNSYASNSSTTIIPSYIFSNGGEPAFYLFPDNYYDLTINSSNSSIILPIKPTVRHSQTNSSPNAYGSSGARTYASSPTLYTSTYPAGSVINTGSGYYYVPYVLTYVTTPYSSGVPTIYVNGDSIIKYIKAGQTINGVFTGSGIIVSTTTVSSSDVSSKAVTLSQNTNAAYTAGCAVLFTTTTASAATAWPTPSTFSDLKTSVYNPVFDGTQPLIYLGSYSDFSTPTTPVALVNNESNAIIYVNDNKQLMIKNANEGDDVAVYTVSGIKVASAVITDGGATINLTQGIYMVKVGAKVTKVLVK